MNFNITLASVCIWNLHAVYFHYSLFFILYTLFSVSDRRKRDLNIMFRVTGIGLWIWFPIYSETKFASWCFVWMNERAHFPDGMECWNFFLNGGYWLFESSVACSWILCWNGWIIKIFMRLLNHTQAADAKLISKFHLPYNSFYCLRWSLKNTSVRVFCPRLPPALLKNRKTRFADAVKPWEF